MDRKQYTRVVIDPSIKTLIDEWHICPYSDGIEDLFATLDACTKSYLKNGPLNTKSIVSIVKDLRGYLNSHKNPNLYYFTDRICDSILFSFKGMDTDEEPGFEDYIQQCVLQVYSRA